MAPRMTVAAVSAPTAASTGEDMSMGASQVAENVSPQVVMVTGKPVCAQASAYDPGEPSCRVVLATLNAHMHLVKMIFAGGRKMKASAELRAMVEVDPARSSRLSASEVCRFQCRSAEGKIPPRTRLRWVRDTFGCEGID